MTQQCSWTQPILLHACSVMADSATHGLWSGRLLCPWNFQAIILEWVAIFFSTRSSRPRDWTHLSCVSSIGKQIVYHRATREIHILVLQIHFSPWRQSIKISYLSVSPPPPITPYSSIPVAFNHGPILLPLPSSAVVSSLLFLSLTDSTLKIFFYWNMPHIQGDFFHILLYSFSFFLNHKFSKENYAELTDHSNFPYMLLYITYTSLQMNFPEL